MRALAGYYLNGNQALSVVVIINSPRAAGFWARLDKLTERLIFPAARAANGQTIGCVAQTAHADTDLPARENDDV